MTYCTVLIPRDQNLYDSYGAASLVVVGLQGLELRRLFSLNFRIRFAFPEDE